MKAPRYAHTKVEAAKLLGMSRTVLYRLLRLPGAPRPRADGRWSIAELRKFALKAAKQIEGPNERDRLQMELLNLKIQRASQELSEFERKVRAEITDGLVPLFSLGPALLKAGMERIRNELCPRFEGMNARQMWRLWRDGERRVFNEVYAELRKKFDISLTEPTENVIQFDQKQQRAAAAKHATG
jgi:hypothetical protein